MKYLNFGTKIAKRSSHNFKHSSLVIKGGKILSFGYNHDSIHAEVNALKDLWPKNRKNSIVINFRIGKDGSLRNSFPCEDCLEYCKKVGVRKVIYSIGVLGFLEVKL